MSVHPPHFLAHFPLLPPSGRNIPGGTHSIFCCSLLIASDLATHVAAVAARAALLRVRVNHRSTRMCTFQLLIASELANQVAAVAACIALWVCVDDNLAIEVAELVGIWRRGAPTTPQARWARWRIHLKAARTVPQRRADLRAHPLPAVTV